MAYRAAVRHETADQEKRTEEDVNDVIRGADFEMVGDDPKQSRISRTGNGWFSLGTSDEARDAEEEVDEPECNAEILRTFEASFGAEVESGEPADEMNDGMRDAQMHPEKVRYRKSGKGDEDESDSQNKTDLLCHESLRSFSERSRHVQRGRRFGRRPFQLVYISAVIDPDLHLPAELDRATLRQSFLSAEPFPHLVLDGLFDPAELREVVRGFPGPADMQWAAFESETEKKLGFHHEKSRLPKAIRQFLYKLNSFEMLSFLEDVTGIEGLIPDPYFGGGGIHQIVRGGFLKIHADFNVHPKLKLDRRLNMLVYLNEPWDDSWGGALELWNRDMSEARATISPLFNRTVVFATSDHSYHGHPSPLACSEETTRKSLSLYYYTNGRPEDERSAAHDTIFVEPAKP